MRATLRRAARSRFAMMVPSRAASRGHCSSYCLTGKPALLLPTTLTSDISLALKSARVDEFYIQRRTLEHKALEKIHGDN
jgi:hypothetical protein